MKIKERGSGSAGAPPRLHEKQMFAENVNSSWKLKVFVLFCGKKFSVWYIWVVCDFEWSKLGLKKDRRRKKQDS